MVNTVSPKVIVVWFRSDLRLHDHPALAAACQEADRVIPLFIFDDHLLHGPHASANRNRFLLECLTDLKHSLRARGSDLVVRLGDSAQVLVDVAREVGAQTVYHSADYTPYALRRDKRVKAALATVDIHLHNFPGRLAISGLQTLQTQTAKPYTIFTPFYKRWLAVERRALFPAPTVMNIPGSIAVGALPSLATVTNAHDLSPDALRGGETAGRQRLENFLAGNIHSYHRSHNDMAGDTTSRLSSYLHFGCLSPREIETLLPEGEGPAAWHRQLAWREFYHYILLHFPDNSQVEFQPRYRSLRWDNSPALLRAWQEGRTGYPIVDAAMRQLHQEGWMHNRARLIAGSFLTKDLGLNWRLGEQYFMRWLIDGDQSNNNGNWQWIASVGVDPAPLFRRLYNPTSQQQTYDPSGKYVRKYVLELRVVPDAFIAQPRHMPIDLQRTTGCVVGERYPFPIIDHALPAKSP